MRKHILSAQNGIYAAVFVERRCGTSAKTKTAEENHFQPTLKGVVKKLACVVGKLDRIADTLCASLLACKLFESRKMRFLMEFRPS
jgi:hypothetical protein